jgi:hypothetical protein
MLTQTELLEIAKLAVIKENLVNAFDDLLAEYTAEEINECKQAILHRKELETQATRPNFGLLAKWQNDPLFRVLAEIDI